MNIKNNEILLRNLVILYQNNILQLNDSDYQKLPTLKDKLYYILYYLEFWYCIKSSNGFEYKNHINKIYKLIQKVKMNYSEYENIKLKFDIIFHIKYKNMSDIKLLDIFVKIINLKQDILFLIDDKLSQFYDTIKNQIINNINFTIVKSDLEKWIKN